MLLGTALSLTLGGRVADLDWAALLPGGRGGALLELYSR